MLQAAIESVQAAPNGGSAPASRGELRHAPPRAVAKAGRVAVIAPAKDRKKGLKRTAEELEGLVKKLHSYVAQNPGQRIEQIGEVLGVTTKELVLPAKKLINEKRLASKGHKRATTSFANKQGAASRTRRRPRMKSSPHRSTRS